MLKHFLNSEYKEISVDGLFMLNCIQDTINDAHNELHEGRDVIKRITWRDHEAYRSCLQLHYGVMAGSDGADLLVKLDRGVRGMDYVDVNIRRLNESEALDASTWLESKLPKYNMLDIKPPFETV